MSKFTKKCQKTRKWRKCHRQIWYLRNVENWLKFHEFSTFSDFSIGIGKGFGTVRSGVSYGWSGGVKTDFLTKKALPNPMESGKMAKNHCFSVFFGVFQGFARNSRPIGFARGFGPRKQKITTFWSLEYTTFWSLENTTFWIGPNESKLVQLGQMRQNGLNASKWPKCVKMA